MFGGNFAPAGWAFCQGQLLPISENDILFTLIGTTYGGDGQSTFALPNLASRVPIHMGTNPSTGTTFTIGQLLGTETETITTSSLPTHSHPLLGSGSDANSATATGNVPAVLPAGTTKSAYGTLNPTGTLDPSSIPVVGGSQPHDNVQPFLAISFIISLFGIFPSQN
jgi:microcystin-dependent protein